MGLKRKSIIAILVIKLSFVSITYAAWEGLAEVVSMTWGQGNGQVGLESADTADTFPRSILISSDNKIAVGDIVNNRIIIFNTDGGLQKAFSPAGIPAGARIAKIQWGFLSGGRLLIKLGDKYQIYDYNGNLQNQFSGVATYIGEIITLSDDSIVVYKTDTKTYSFYSSTGQLIKTSTTRPLEVGIVKEQRIGDANYQITISYPDRNYTLKLKGPYEKYIRDSNDYIYAVSGKEVRRFDHCGKELASLSTPENQYKLIRSGGRGLDAIYDLVAEYGEPVIAPNGDVYTWKRTPDKYSILKWTWVDDPNVPTGPDAPSGLTVTPSINGLYLTWTASPNDPGCVTKYEIARSTTSGGVFSTIDTVDKGVIKYNDTTASAGTQYYYKVRAMAGSEFSPYTAEVSGKR